VKSFFTPFVVAGLALTTALSAQAAEVITAASDVGYPPFASVAPDGSYEGMDIDIAKALSKQMGAEIKIIDQSWSTTYAGLNAKKFDMVLSAAMINNDRASAMLFVEPYGDATYQFVQRTADPKIKSPDDLKKKVVAVNRGNLFDKWLSSREEQYGWTINRYDKNSDAVQAVASGQADAALVYSASAGAAAKKVPMLTVSDYVINNGEVYGYSVRKDDGELRNKLDMAMECIKKSGELATIYEKWTGLKPLKGGVVETVLPGYGAPGYPNYDATEHTLSCR
jgi:polar amino acid transport system substrate-binding protein